MTQTPDANDWLMSGGIKAVTFKGEPPIAWEGTITEDPTITQKRDFDSGELLFWSDGNPRMQMRVVIQTDAKDDPEDDGKRTLYLDGRKAAAVRDAVRSAGAKKLEVGGRVSITYTSDDIAAKRGKLNPPKNFEAKYTPPADEWLKEPAGSEWSQQTIQQPVASRAQVDPYLVQFLASKGVQVTPEMTQQTAELLASTFK